MNSTRFLISQFVGRTMCAPPRLKVLVDVLPVVPTNESSAEPSWRGGGVGAGAWARTIAGAASEETKTSDPNSPVMCFCMCVIVSMLSGAVLSVPRPKRPIGGSGAADLIHGQPDSFDHDRASRCVRLRRRYAHLRT